MSFKSVIDGHHASSIQDSIVLIIVEGPYSKISLQIEVSCEICDNVGVVSPYENSISLALQHVSLVSWKGLELSVKESVRVVFI